MAHTASSGPKPAKVRELIPNKGWLWIVGMLGILAFLLYPSLTMRLGKPSKSDEERVEKVVKYQLDPVSWTEWISFAELKPSEVPDDARFQFQVNAPGWHEYKFWDSPDIHVPGKSENEDASKRWLGESAKSTFKLRGEGEAILRITYIFSR